MSKKKLRTVDEQLAYKILKTTWATFPMLLWCLINEILYQEKLSTNCDF